MAQIHTAVPVVQAPPHQPLVASEQSLPSHLDAVSPFVDRLIGFVVMLRGADGSERDIEIALREAIVNAVIHGNAEAAEKRVYVVCRCTMDGEISITVRDEGQGFDIDAVPDSTTAENRLSSHGRGIYLMKVLMDEVSFDQGGTVVHMRKKANVAWSRPSFWDSICGLPSTQSPPRTTRFR
jgi:serine/threonine-protein kinase RsbW